MSVDMTVPGSGASRGGGRWSRPAVRAGIAAALLLARLRPARLRSVLTRLAASAVPADAATVADAYDAVVAASPRCAGWRGCLPRSIAVALLCRRHGTWPEWCAGVRGTPPFAAHAWVESEGRLVREAGTPDDYRALIRVRPGRPGAGVGGRT